MVESPSSRLEISKEKRESLGYQLRRLSGLVGFRKVDVRLPGTGDAKLPWREAGSHNHHDDIVDSDQ